ncbi:Deoxycytidylate deaminase [Elusimicrobium minutum Pei191]|uniref:Deoxycytidylate deaminase n=1 Tax=Elusimicrobium minutum (strain Pei191) TaxID=445932 RepID=B2KDX9_ELUMP|nr:deaminase [Elusimicrobium minutum]ACC98725.1 Deoxycytidylate deaminase [Elusimicrobium minutum Pei191]
MKNKHKLFIEMAKLIAAQSTCCRLQVGAVLVKDNRVISIGYNGVPSGQCHCDDNFAEIYKKEFSSQYATLEEFLKSPDFFKVHGQWSMDNELHAEQNAILFAAKNGISTAGATVYVTLSPCINCAKVIVSAGIERVYFLDLYDRSQEGNVFLAKSGIECRQLTAEEIA